MRACLHGSSGTPNLLVSLSITQERAAKRLLQRIDQLFRILGVNIKAAGPIGETAC